MIDLLPKDDPIRRTIAPARRLLNQIQRTRLVNLALRAGLTPWQVDALPVDIVEAALAFVSDHDEPG